MHAIKLTIEMSKLNKGSFDHIQCDIMFVFKSTLWINHLTDELHVSESGWGKKQPNYLDETTGDAIDIKCTQTQAEKGKEREKRSQTKRMGLMYTKTHTRFYMQTSVNGMILTVIEFLFGMLLHCVHRREHNCDSLASTLNHFRIVWMECKR